MRIYVFNTLLPTAKGKENKGSFKTTKATDLEANPEKIEAKVENKEVPKEKARVESVRTLKEWFGDQHLAVGRS
jgi:hypothetical protein